MKVVGFSGYSGAGKTTLVERLVARLRQSAQRVSVVKHAHHDFDIDRPGKDSYRHRAAGAFEVLIASDRRLAKLREFDVAGEPSVHQLIAELHDCDWVLVDGFKHADVPKIEVWRAETGKPVQYVNDPFIVAIAAPSGDTLPEPTGLPRFDLDDPDGVADFLLGHTARYEYSRTFANPFDESSSAAAVAG